MLAFGLLSVFWGNFGQSFFVSWYGAGIQKSLGLTATTYGSAYSAATFASGMTLILVGGLIDRMPLGRFATIVALGLTSAALVLSAADNLVILTAGFFLLRLFGQGLFPHTGITAMARHFEANRGKAISIAISGVPLGEVVLPLLIVAIIAAVGWQKSWLLVALSVPLIYLPWARWLLARAGPPETDDTTTVHESTNAQAPPPAAGRRAMLADYRFWLALPAVLAGPFIVTGVFIQQDFFLVEKGWTPVWFAACFAVYGAVHWLSSLTAGVLVDKWTARRLLPFYVLPLAVAMFATANLSGQWLAVLLLGSFGLSIGASGPITGALWAEVYGTAHIGAIRSLVTAFGVLSSSVSPVLFGYLIDRGVDSTQLLNGVGWFTVAALVMVRFSYRTLRRH